MEGDVDCDGLVLFLDSLRLTSSFSTLQLRAAAASLTSPGEEEVGNLLLPSTGKCPAAGNSLGAFAAIRAVPKSAHLFIFFSRYAFKTEKKTALII